MSKFVNATNPFLVNGREHFYVLLTLIDPNTGTVRRLKKSTGIRTDADNALSKAHEVRLRMLAEYQSDYDPTAPTRLKDFAESYAKDRELERLSRSSVTGIRSAFNALITSVGATVFVTAVCAKEVRKFLLTEQTHSSVALAHYRYLHAAFQRAVQDGMIPSNPFDQVDKKLLMKRHQPRPRGILRAEEVLTIFALIPKVTYSDRVYRNVFLFLFGTAFRRDEARCLEVGDVDRTTGIISLRSTEQRPLKTIASEADIAITDHARRALDEQFKNRAQHARECVRESAYVFCNEHGKPYNPMTLTHEIIRRVKQVCGSLHIKADGFDLHSLRHSLIQHLIDSGAEPAIVSKFARHANLATTLNSYHKTKDTRTKFESILRVTDQRVASTAPNDAPDHREFLKSSLENTGVVLHDHQNE